MAQRAAAALEREVAALPVLTDCARSVLPVTRLLAGRGLSRSERRAKADLGRKLAQQALEVNADRLRLYEIEGDVGFRGDDPVLQLETGNAIGAFPLRSPTTGRDDMAVVIRPRFGWEGLSTLLGGCGFAALPALTPLPMLPRSEREIPPWVLSSVVLDRIERLLRQMERRFDYCEEELARPRGTLRLERWATQNLPRGRQTTIPCRFPDLRDDEEVLSAVHWTLLRHRGALESQRAGGLAVRRLLEDCAGLLRKVEGVAPRRPARRLLGFDRRRGPRLGQALEAVGWTVDERGLAGMADLGGLPWKLSMEAAFEVWVEALVRDLARGRAMQVIAGRDGQTRARLRWEANASMGSLLPDVVVRAGETVLVVDAKYKDHWSAVVRRGWDAASSAAKEVHRSDVHQVMAYASLFSAKRVVSCLVYPLRQEDEEQRPLRRGQLVDRQGIELALMGVPIDQRGLKRAGELLSEVLAKPLV